MVIVTPEFGGSDVDQVLIVVDIKKEIQPCDGDLTMPPESLAMLNVNQHA